MTENTDRLRILQMIEEGKLDAAEGARMLASGTVPDLGGQAQAGEAGKTPRWIRVNVADVHTGKTRVNVRIPVNLISTGIKMGAHLSSDMQELNIQQINEFIRKGVTGPVMEVVDDEEDEKVTISLE
jgi:hypothetical protein